MAEIIAELTLFGVFLLMAVVLVLVVVPPSLVPVGKS